MDRLRRWWSGLSRRGKVIVTAVVATLVLALGYNPPSGEPGAGASPDPSRAAAVPSPTAVPIETPNPSIAVTLAPTEAPDATPEPLPTAEPADKPIPGLAAVDVTGNLVDRGFDCGDIEVTDTGVLYECILTAPDAEQRVLVLGTAPGSITLVDSTALDFGPNPGDSALAFLQYMATIPCEGCEQAAAQQWVRDNFEPGGEQVIGPLILVMYGDADSKILEIRAAP